MCVGIEFETSIKRDLHGCKSHCKYHPDMNTYVPNKSNRINNRMESSPIQRKLQKVSRDAIENVNFGEKMRTPVQRRVVRIRSGGTSSARGSRAHFKEDLSPLQRRLQRNSSAGSNSRSSRSGSATNSSSRDEKATVESVLELLDILQNSPHHTKNDETSIMTDSRKPLLLQRTYSDEIFTPSRRHKRTGVRMSLRMMPKEKPASMGDLYNKNGTSNRKSGRRKKDGKPREGSPHSLKGRPREGSPHSLRGRSREGSPHSLNKRREKKKGEERPRLDDVPTDSSPRSPRSRMNQDLHPRWLPDGEDDHHLDLNDTDHAVNWERNNRKEINTIRDYIAIESSPSKYGKTRKTTDESVDNSYFQEASCNSALGDFQLDRSQRPNRKPCKSQNASGDEKSPGQRKERNVVLHSTSNDEEEKARRRSRKCSAGGKVRNHRTLEEYIGFFLTSPTEDNLKHGYGITKFADGRLFEGVYERGIMIEGKMTYPAVGDGPSPTYVGKFDEDGLRCGKGIYTTAHTTFLGQFRLDQQHGSGILIYHDDSDSHDTSQSRRFIGHWKDGRKHGYGREILADGTVDVEGLWEAGHFVGNSRRRRA